MGLKDQLDWVAKLEAYRSRDELDWDHPKLALIDLQYHDERKAESLRRFHRASWPRPGTR